MLYFYRHWQRRRLLEEALSSVSVNVIDVLKKNIEVLLDLCDSEESMASKENALDEILNWVDNVDFANGNGTLILPCSRLNK